MFLEHFGLMSEHWSSLIEGIVPTEVVQDKTIVGEDLVTASAWFETPIFFLVNGVFFAHDPVKKELASQRRLRKQ